MDSVSFEMSAGDFVALHGPSGCGKSTLLLMTGGLLSPDEGIIEIAGENPYQLNAEGRSTFRGEHPPSVMKVSTNGRSSKRTHRDLFPTVAAAITGPVLQPPDSGLKFTLLSRK